MESTTPTLEKLNVVGRRYRRATRQLEAAREELHQVIRQARAEGAKYDTITRLTGLTAARIGQIVHEGDR